VPSTTAPGVPFSSDGNSTVTRIRRGSLSRMTGHDGRDSDEALVPSAAAFTGSPNASTPLRATLGFGSGHHALNRRGVVAAISRNAGDDNHRLARIINFAALPIGPHPMIVGALTDRLRPVLRLRRLLAHAAYDSRRLRKNSLAASDLLFNSPLLFGPDASNRRRLFGPLHLVHRRRVVIDGLRS